MSRLKSPRAALVCSSVLLAAAFTGCAPGGNDAAGGVATEETTMRLPVSLNDMMVALINHSADPIWVADWNAPKSDRDWRELERHAYQLHVGGSLLPIPGTGPVDDEWVAEPGWTKWSFELRDSGMDAIRAIQARDPGAIRLAGDRIVEACEGCHIEFKFPLPTGGRFGELPVTSADVDEAH